MGISTPTKIPIVGPAYRSRVQLLNNQTCVNMFVSIENTAGGKEPAALVRTPGSTVVSSPAVGQVRGGIIVQSGQIFVVVNTVLYEISATGVATSRGTVAGATKVWMAENGIGFYQIMITTNSPTAYIYNYSTNTLVQITHPSFPVGGASTVAFIDGHFIFTEPDTQKVWISELYDGLTYNGTKFKSAESWPDNLVGLAVANRLIYLFGTQTTEVWTNQDLEHFPFGRQPGGVFQTGCRFINTITQFGSKVYWLADDLVVKMTDGYESRVISTPAIDYAISTYSNPTSAEAYCFKLAGQEFFCLTFRDDDITWVFSHASQLWHRWKSFGQGRYGANSSVQLQDKVYVGNWSTGNISLLSYDVYEEDGQPIVCERTTQVIANDAQRLTMTRLVLDIDTGLTQKLGGPGSDPKIGMSYSDDGGRTWSYEIERSLGKQGEYNKRLVWTRLGTFRDRLLRFRTSAPVSFAILGAYAELEAGVW